jgi:hypothetical protein
MNLDVDYLIDFFTKNSDSNDEDEMNGEIGEQDAAPAAATTPSTGGGGGSIPKWADVYGFKQGKANPKTAGSPKWETGLTRGLANQIW